MRFLSIIMLLLILSSCSHLNYAKNTDLKNIIEVQITDDKKHEPKVGQVVKIFNLRPKPPHKRNRNGNGNGEVYDYSTKESEVEGKIVEVISNEKVMIEVSNDFEVNAKTRVEY